MKEGWEYKKLGEVCELYQPKTLSTKELIENGDYPVYGANGIIGRYSKYNHEKSEILMTCRGATCGTINISQPFAWINGNAMVIHPITDNIYNAFLVYQLKGIDLSDVITGAAQPQITRQTLSPKIIGIPKYSVQLNIVSELDLLSGVIEKQKAQLEELDKLAQSIFYDMFGDPVTNEKGWKQEKLGHIFQTSSGGTPSKNNIEYYEGGSIPWLRSGEVSQGFIYKTELFITEAGMNNSSAKIFPVDTVAIAMYGATVGQVGIIKVPMTTNQAVCGLFPNPDYSPIFMMFFLKGMQPVFLKDATGGAQPNISQGIIKNTYIPLISLSLQQEFAAKVEAIEAMKEKVRQSLKEAETLFNERMDYYFN